VPQPSPPAADEFAAFYAGYVGRVASVSAPFDELISQRERLLSLLSRLSDDRASFRYAPGKWSVKELVGHLADAERIFAYRMLRIGRGDTTPLPGFEENDYVRAAASDTRVFGDLLDEWAAVRDATARLAAGMPADAWQRRGTASGAGISARALLYIILGHVEHHRAVLEERYGLTSG
jgi:uncharacterized damage-inducible protein DinB